MTYKTFKTFFF